MSITRCVHLQGTSYPYSYARCVRRAGALVGPRPWAFFKINCVFNKFHSVSSASRGVIVGHPEAWQWIPRLKIRRRSTVPESRPPAERRDTRGDIVFFEHPPLYVANTSMRGRNVRGDPLMPLEIAQGVNYYYCYYYYSVWSLTHGIASRKTRRVCTRPIRKLKVKRWRQPAFSFLSCFCDSWVPFFFFFFGERGYPVHLARSRQTPERKSRVSKRQKKKKNSEKRSNSKGLKNGYFYAVFVRRTKDRKEIGKHKWTNIFSRMFENSCCQRGYYNIWYGIPAVCTTYFFHRETKSPLVVTLGWKFNLVAENYFLFPKFAVVCIISEHNMYLISEFRSRREKTSIISISYYKNRCIVYIIVFSKTYFSHVDI